MMPGTVPFPDDEEKSVGNQVRPAMIEFELQAVKMS